MRTHRVFWLSLLILFSAAHVYGVDEVSKDFTFTDSAPGSKVQISGTFPGEGKREVLIGLPGKPDKEAIRVVPEVSPEKKVLSFDIPKNLTPGRYFVKIELHTSAAVPTGTAAVPGGTAVVPGGTAVVSVGELRVTAPQAAEVKVEKVEPVRYYPDEQGRYSFLISGANFSDVPENNIVEVNKEPLKLVRCPESEETAANAAKGSTAANATGPLEPRPQCVKSQRGAETRLLIVEGFEPRNYTKPLQVALRVGDSENVSAEFPVTFSRLTKTQLKLLATAAFLALMLIVYLLVRTGIKLGKIDGRFASLRAFLIDRETNSYSLSKFQLTLFTLVTIFGYIYIFVCRLAVQWRFELPPVPEGLPGMMAVSLGTTVVAAGVAANVGGKGAGPVSPSFADFISSGGVVLPERFQFFLWTIVSSMGVLVLILASDPVTVQQLPELPDGMLYLIGLSSAGYLGGKMIRGPGPSIKSIDAAKVTTPAGETALEVVLTGDNLANDATFQLDDEHIPTTQVVATPITPDSRNPKYSTKLKVQFKNVAERYFEKPHLLRIVNPDSQGADIKYGATVESVGPIASGNDPIKVIVTGANFKDPSSAVWFEAPGTGNGVEIPAENIKKVSDTELEVTLTPGPTAGKAKLVIKSPGELTTTFEVMVG